MLNKQILDKYNMFFVEVASFYNIQKYIQSDNTLQLNVVAVSNIGFKIGKEQLTLIENVYLFLDKEYKYLLPFYRFYYEVIKKDVNKEYCRIQLQQINRVIKIIRKLK